MIVPKAVRMGPASRVPLTTGVTLVTLLLMFAAAPLAAGPPLARLPMTDRGPFNGLIGIPDGWTQVDGPVAELAWQVANNAMGEIDGTETLLLDGETHTVTLRWQRTLAGRLAIGVELPWIAHGGGFLDDAIDTWHDALGLSQGIRPLLPEDQLRYEYTRTGPPDISVTDATSGIGDLRTALAWRPFASVAGRPTLDVTAEIEWPTGDAARLTGNGGTDVAAGLRLGRTAASTRAGLGRLGWAMQAGVVWPGTADAPLPAAVGQFWYYDAALAWPAGDVLDLVVQIQGHGGPWQSDLEMLGDTALQLGLGAIWHARSGLSLRFGLFEDIRTDTTPDFALELALTYQPGSRSGLAPRPLDAE